MTTNPPLGPQPLTAGALDALLLDTTPWLSCDDCFARMDTHVEALLGGSSHDPAMDRHLLGCVACAEEAESLLELLHRESR